MKTFLRKRNKIVLRPAERDDGRSRLRPRRRADLRQGRHAAAPALSAERTRRRTSPAPRSSRRGRPARRARRRCARARDRPGRSCTPRCRARRSARRRSSRASAAPAGCPTPISSATSGCDQVRRRGRRRVQTSTSSASAQQRVDLVDRVVERTRRRVAAVDDDLAAVGHDVVGDPALDAHDLERLAVRRGRRRRRSRPRSAAMRPSSGAARWIAFAPIHGRAECARAPSNVARTWIVPWQPASTHPPVGSSRIARSPATSSGRSANRRRSPLCSSATSSPS